MARVTVEDCVKRIPNRFEMVLLATHRTRQIAAGATLLVDRDRDKNHVVALREIGDDKLTKEELRKSMTAKLCRYSREVIGADEPDTKKPAKEMSEEEMVRRLPGMRVAPPSSSAGL